MSYAKVDKVMNYVETLELDKLDYLELLQCIEEKVQEEKCERVQDE